MEYEFQQTTPEERRARRQQREQARRARRRRQRLRLLKRALPPLVLAAILLTAAGWKCLRGGEEPPAEEAAALMQMMPAVTAEPEPEPGPYVPKQAARPAVISEEMTSQYAVVLDLSTDTILAGRNADTVINPASMTKILTVLVAAEQVKNLEDTFTIPIAITDYSFSNGCSVAGFELGETVTVRDLFYATVLPSGADGALGLAYYVSGSQEAFMELMNEKLEELGLSDTAHFTNCVGIYDQNHHCTVTDMALMLKAAMENDFCREVLSARTYTTSATEQHPEGMLLSNWFLRRIEDKDDDAVMPVVGGKTGYVVQSGNCAASFGISPEGRELICVTADASGVWRCIYDHVALYQQFGGA
ncbi:D-alanyl-D-alanine carboxypeptidase family protein [Dysosmobacter sp.]|uniref:D-alanyl-D-alanine carboxypeptidase family protein n=1 Tax=Dysosmobacter sp. TaxID=2591382 RepID=UPI002A885375|nr:serine hydrolase [Dysosmobacter sp.]MDY3281461.1 serine hydrolase [Dysosmobacter sp.]